MKFTKDRKFVKEWGHMGAARGEFRTPHALAFDSRGRLFVADRGNHRIQIFDQDGKHLDTYQQYSRISGLFITPDDMLYAIDSDTNATNHAGWKMGFASARRAPIQSRRSSHRIRRRPPVRRRGRGCCCRSRGNVYAAEGPISRAAAEGGLTKYLKQ
jgi:sugar lactone lactonase YvrE